MLCSFYKDEDLKDILELNQYQWSFIPPKKCASHPHGSTRILLGNYAEDNDHKLVGVRS